MEITLYVVGQADSALESDLDDLFQHVQTDAEAKDRLRWRIKALARIWGVEESYVEFDSIFAEDQDLWQGGDALDVYEDVVGLHWWLSTANEWEKAPILARVVTDGFKYMDFDNLGKEVDLLWHAFEGDYEDLARSLVSDGVLESPGDTWDWYVDWEEKGKDIAADYDEYELDGVTYLFGA
jgi:hypothetical protein